MRKARETLIAGSRTLFRDDVPIAEHIARIRDIVGKRETVLLSELAPDSATRPILIGTFLGVLELIRGREIGVEQDEPFGTVRVYLRTDRTEDAVEPLDEPEYR